MPVSTTSIGVVGCGYWGPNLIRNFSVLPHAKVSALCDQKDDRLFHMQSLYPAAQKFTDFAKMLKDAELDAVAIATPVHTHFKLARAALKAGKNVLIEKPMASSVAQCEELVELADEMGLTLMVGHTYLYSKPILYLAELVKRGDLGKLLYINSQRLSLGLFQKDINVVWDLAPHDLSIILHILGAMPRSLNCQGNAHITPGVEDVTNISLDFGDGKFAMVQSSWLEPRKVRQMTIVGETGMVVYDDLETLEKIRIYDRRVERPPHYDTYDQFHYAYHYGDCHIPHLQQEEPLSAMCRHFVDCIVEGAVPLSCGRQGAKLVSILEACSASLRSAGSPIEVADLDLESRPVAGPASLSRKSLSSAVLVGK